MGWLLELLRPSIAQAKNDYKQAAGHYALSQLKLQGIKATFDRKRDAHNTLLINNAALLAVGGALVKPDEAYQKFVAEMTKPLDEALLPEGYSPETLAHWDDVPGGEFIKGALHNFDRIANGEASEEGGNPVIEGIDGVAGILEGFALGGINVIPGSEDIPLPTWMKSIATLPFNIMAAGLAATLNVVTAVFNPGASKKKYDDARAKVESAQEELDEAKAALNTGVTEFDKEIDKLKGQFLQICGRLDAIAPHPYFNTLSMEDSNESFISVQQQAVSDFGNLIAIRNAYLRIKNEDPTLEDEQIASFVADNSEWEDFTEEQIKDLIALVVRMAQEAE